MDKERFEKITQALLERTVKNNQYRRKLERMARQGKPLPEPYEDCLTWIAKPQMRACEDCSIISTNNLKHIQLEKTSTGLKWIKQCDECGKKIPLSPR